MTAELWLEKPCEEHGSVKRHCICNCIVPDPQHGEWCWCEGGSRVRLDKVGRIQVREVTAWDSGHKHIIDPSDLVFVDMEHDIATGLAPGTYLVVGLDGLEEEE